MCAEVLRDFRFQLAESHQNIELCIMSFRAQSRNLFFSGQGNSRACPELDCHPERSEGPVQLSRPSTQVLRFAQDDRMPKDSSTPVGMTERLFVTRFWKAQ